jgi:hypothetical protein
MASKRNDSRKNGKANKKNPSTNAAGKTGRTSKGYLEATLNLRAAKRTASAIRARVAELQVETPEEETLSV